MRAVVQRVKSARVEVEGETIGAVDHGLARSFLGVTHSDTEKDAKYLAEKIAGLRIFEDAEDKMNLSVQDVGGSILSVSSSPCSAIVAVDAVHPSPRPRVQSRASASTKPSTTNCARRDYPSPPASFRRTWKCRL